MSEMLEDAGKILAEYLTWGTVSVPNMFDDHFGRVDALLPDTFKQPPERAWRAIAISRELMRTLEAGQPIELEPRAFSSWASTREAAERYMRGRVEIANEQQVVILIEKPLQGEKVVADVRGLYRALQWDCSDVEEWSLYVEWEKEFILHNSPRLLSIAPHEVVFSQACTEMLQVQDVESAGVMRPFTGEWLYDEEEEADLKIVAVCEDQPFLKEGGIWQVEGDDDNIYSISNEGDGWNTTPHLLDYQNNRSGRLRI